MRRPSIRGFGIRYAIALTLPVTGIVVVLYTVVQLFGYVLRERRSASVSPPRAIAGSMGPAAVLPAASEATAEPAVPEHPRPKR